MPTFPEGSAAHLHLSEDWDGTQGDIATATWTPVDGINRYQRANNATSTDESFFMRTQAITVAGKPARSITLTGKLAIGDAGQQLLRSANADRSVIGFRFRPEGIAGAEEAYAVFVKVGGGEDQAEAAGGMQVRSWTLAPQDDDVLELTGS